MCFCGQLGFNSEIHFLHVLPLACVELLSYFKWRSLMPIFPSRGGRDWFPLQYLNAIYAVIVAFVSSKVLHNGLFKSSRNHIDLLSFLDVHPVRTHCSSDSVKAMPLSVEILLFGLVSIFCRFMPLVSGLLTKSHEWVNYPPEARLPTRVPSIRCIWDSGFDELFHLGVSFAEDMATLFQAGLGVTNNYFCVIVDGAKLVISGGADVLSSLIVPMFRWLIHQLSIFCLHTSATGSIHLLEHGIDVKAAAWISRVPDSPSKWLVKC